MSKTVRVTDRKQHPYTVIDNRTLEDTRLSWAARGIIAYLLAKPDDWQIRVEDLRKRGDLGRDSLYAVLKALRRFGYLGRTRDRDDRGRFGDGDSTLYEVPVPGSPDTAEPDTAPPDTGKPYPAEPTLLSNKYTKESDNQITTTTTTGEPKPGDKTSGGSELVFPKSLSSAETAEARRKLDGLSNPRAQELLDELTARLESGAVHDSPLAYLRGLVKRAWGGDFTPEAGLRISATRAKARENEAALRRAQSLLPRLPQPDPNNPLVQRVEAIRARVNGSRPGGVEPRDPDPIE